MQTGRSSSPQLITRQPALRQLAERLSGESILAVDTESNSLYAYFERVCLIQFSTPQEDFLVDPLALDDLSALGPLFADARIEKVFHAAEYDIISMRRDFDFSFDNLFDTMLAARILGWDEMGLGSILGREFDVQLNKRYQRANWGKRPLPQDMLEYASQDSHYLIPLRYRLKAELKAKGRWPLAQEDFNRLRYVNGRDRSEVTDSCWRVRGAYDLSPVEAGVLLELCMYRDQVAQSLNLPVFKILNDQTLILIATGLPGDLHELQRAARLNEKQLNRHAEHLLRAVQRGLQAGPVYLPRTSRPDERYLARLDALRAWRKKTAQQMGVNSDVVLPRDLLNALASLDGITRADVQAILSQSPWRLAHYGDQILSLLENL